MPLQAVAIKDVPTKPIEGQKTGTSGLRKKTKVGHAERTGLDRMCASYLSGISGAYLSPVPTRPQEFMSPNYLANWVQSLFNALGAEAKGKVLGLGGDGRYFGKEAAQQIIKLAAGNGFSKVVVGKDAIMATPAMSALIRGRKLYGEHPALSASSAYTGPFLHGTHCSSPSIPGDTFQR